jgi:hypothetical protein
MNKKKLRRLKRRLATLRQRIGNIKSSELQRLAQALGRYHDTSRGKEPTFVSQLLHHSRPISIPNHPGSLKKFTAGNILDKLEEDIVALEELLAEEERS